MYKYISCILVRKIFTLKGKYIRIKVQSKIVNVDLLLYTYCTFTHMEQKMVEIRVELRV